MISFFIWIIIPICNFIFWFQIGKNKIDIINCPIINNESPHILPPLPCPIGMKLKSNEYIPKDNSNNGSCKSPELDIKIPFISIENTINYDTYRSDRLAPMIYPNEFGTIIEKMYEDDICKSIFNSYIPKTSEQCYAIVRLSNMSEYTSSSKNPRGASYNILRFEDGIDELGMSLNNNEDVAQMKSDPSYIFKPNEHNIGKLRPTGYFRKVPILNGRIRLKMKLHSFLISFKSINDHLEYKLKVNKITKGSNIVVMVVNNGEIDLFMNFACSCKSHKISLKNIIVFASSEEIIPMIESTGALGMYHNGYGMVSKNPSIDYLDRVFVDMMWYKAFSVYLLLRLGINILFQDADLVWFKDPFQYFHDITNQTYDKSQISGSFIESFFSDDGQRSLRYAPFYANSGFYYLKASEKSEYFTWSIMTAFDSVQRLGSHQNVFTTRMNEGLGISHQHSKLLPMDDFPTGYQYHHDKKYMKDLFNKQISPYGFHMCWTQGKPDKLVYLKKVFMWYLKDECSSFENFLPGSDIYRSVSNNRLSYSKWDLLSNQCCQQLKYSP